MNKKFGLSQAARIVTLGIILVLISVYVPMLAILALVVPVPFAIIGTLCERKYAFLSLISTFGNYVLCRSYICYKYKHNECSSRINYR